jgi:hypothetical protein
MEKPRQQHTGNQKAPGSKDTNVEPTGQGTTRSPADADIERAGGVRPGRGAKTSEAGGVG